MEEQEISLKNCSDDQVLSWQQTTLKVEQLKEKLRKTFSTRNLSSLISSVQIQEIDRKNREQFLDRGIDCEILKPSETGWQKGKVRLHVNFTIEFIPDEPEIEKPKIDEPESPLDDFRKEKVE